jgi:hypothetical protein
MSDNEELVLPHVVTPVSIRNDDDPRFVPFTDWLNSQRQLLLSSIDTTGAATPAATLQLACGKVEADASSTGVIEADSSVGENGIPKFSSSVIALETLGTQAVAPTRICWATSATADAAVAASKVNTDGFSSGSATEKSAVALKTRTEAPMTTVTEADVEVTQNGTREEVKYQAWAQAMRPQVSKNIKLFGTVLQYFRKCKCRLYENCLGLLLIYSSSNKNPITSRKIFRKYMETLSLLS